MRKNKMAAVLMLALLAFQSVFSEFKRGEILQDIICKENTEYSYLLYLPENFTPDREEKWPVLFFLGGGGGVPAMVKKFVPAAEHHEWIIAISTQCSDGFPESETAVRAMINDVFATFPIDQQQWYAGGIGFGADMAYRMADAYDKQIAGLLTLNRSVPTKSVRKPDYIFCRADHGARNKILFQSDNLKDEYVIDFFSSDLNFPTEEKLTFALQWLQAQFINKKGTEQQRERFSTRMLSDIKSTLPNDPYLAFKKAELMSGLKKLPDFKTAKELREELAEFPEIERCIEARKALQDFIDDYIDLRPQEYDQQYRNSKEPAKAAEELSTRYSDTPFAAVIRDLGAKTPIQNAPSQK